MPNFTYDQFENEARNKGLYDSFSQGDLLLAQRNPDAGMSILTAKDNYRNAQTDQQRSEANALAESIRSSYGGYTGGTDGSGYTLTQMSPIQYAAPEYDNPLQGEYLSMLDSLVNRPDFSYDAASDPLYSQYRKQYAREGQRAAQDTMGSYAAMTGGVPSSYAVSAAQQAGNYYNAQMTDKIPELYQAAYDRYLQDYQMQLSNLNAVGNAEQRAYDRYQADRNFGYQQMLDEISAQGARRQEALTRAQYGAQIGDYAPLRELGYDTAALQQDRNYELLQRLQENAQFGAQVGDYSGYAGLGFDPSYAQQSQREALQAQQIQNAMARYEAGDTSGLTALGIDPSTLERRTDLAEALQLYQVTGNANALAALGVTPSLANVYRLALAEKGIYIGEPVITSGGGMQTGTDLYGAGYYGAGYGGYSGGGYSGGGGYSTQPVTPVAETENSGLSPAALAALEALNSGRSTLTSGEKRTRMTQ